MSYHIPEFISEKGITRIKPDEEDKYEWLSVKDLWWYYTTWCKEANINITKLTKFQFSDLFEKEVGVEPRNSQDGIQYGKVFPFRRIW